MKKFLAERCALGDISREPGQGKGKSWLFPLPPPRCAPFLEEHSSTSRRTLRGGPSRRVHVSWTVIRIVRYRFSVALSGLIVYCRPLIFLLTIPSVNIAIRFSVHLLGGRSHW